VLIRPGEHVPIARLLNFLAQGEHLAHDVAHSQATLTTDPHVRRFLLSQARQEAFHAVVFQGASAWLAPRHLGASPSLRALDQYRARVTEALQRKDLYESIMAEQIILEGLGEALLTRIEAGLVKRHAGFRRLRQILLHQEEAHYAFGRRLLERAMTAGETDPDRLRLPGHEYLALSEAMVTMVRDLFDSIDEDAAAWCRDAKRYVPEWLR